MNATVEVIVRASVKCCACDVQIVKSVLLPEDSLITGNHTQTAKFNMQSIKGNAEHEAERRGWQMYGQTEGPAKPKCMKCIAREIDQP
jgi:hypothetical protein